MVEFFGNLKKEFLNETHLTGNCHEHASVLCDINNTVHPVHDYRLIFTSFPEITHDTSYSTQISELRTMSDVSATSSFKDIWPDSRGIRGRGEEPAYVSLARDRSVWNVCGNSCFANCVECKNFYLLFPDVNW